MKFICMYLWDVITNGVIIDSNVDEVMLLLMIILIKSDGVIDDNVTWGDVFIDDNIEMR